MADPKNDDKEAQEKKKDKADQIQKLSVYTGIPALMIGGVLVGYFVGHYLDKRFHGNNIILSVCLLVGFAAGCYQVIEMIKKFK